MGWEVGLPIEIEERGFRHPQAPRTRRGFRHHKLVGGAQFTSASILGAARRIETQPIETADVWRDHSKCVAPSRRSRLAGRTQEAGYLRSDAHWP